MAYEILKRRLRSLVDAFEEIEGEMGEAVNDSDANVLVGMVRVAVLVLGGAAGRKDAGTVEARVEGVGLACVNHEKDLVVSDSCVSPGE